LEILLRALELDTRHPYDAVLNNLSIVCLRLGRADEAIAYARRVQDIKPGTDIDDTLAMAYALKGDDEKAREAANAWRRRNPGGNVGQPEAWASDAYKKAWLAFYPPLWRKAGLPE
jgi:tetratricopeptide (TPR) repeat protein